MYKDTALFFALFFIQTAQYCLSLGAIVKKALETEDLTGTAVLVGIQSTAALIALCISILIKRTPRMAQHILPYFIIGWFFASVMLYGLDTFSSLWLFIFLIRLSASFWIASYLLATLDNIIKGDRLLANKRAQYFSMCGNLLGYSLGPVLASYFGLKLISILDIAFIFIAILGIAYCGAFRQAARQPSEVTINIVISHSMLPVYYVSTIMCIITGIFAIVEVPILEERFAAAPEVISAVYVGTILLNLLGMKFFTTTSNKYTLVLAHIVSAILLIVTTNTYLFTYTWFGVIASLVIFGLANGVFNVAQTSLVQLLESQSQRLTVFLLFRFIGQFTLLFSVTLSLIVEKDSIPHVVLLASLVLTMPFLWIMQRAKK